MTDDDRQARLAAHVGMTSTPPDESELDVQRTRDQALASVTALRGVKLERDKAEAAVEQLKGLLAEHVAESLRLHARVTELETSIRTAPSTGQIDLHAMWLASQAERRYAEQALGNIRRVLIDEQHAPFHVMATTIADIFDIWQRERELRAGGR